MDTATTGHAHVLGHLDRDARQQGGTVLDREMMIFSKGDFGRYKRIGLVPWMTTIICNCLIGMLVT